MAKYARASFLDGEEGIVSMRLQIGSDGSVTDVQIATSSGSPRLDQAAKDAVKDWRYQPATLNGSPVPASIPVEITWALQTLQFELTPDQARNLSSYYPRGLRAEGVSTVRFLAMPDGTIAKVLVDRSSGTPRLDLAAIEMLTRGWRLTPGTLTTHESVGGWFRLNIVWRLPDSRIPPNFGAACGLPSGPFNREVTIRGCTEYLARTNLNSFERGEAYRMRGNAYVLNRDVDQAIADFSAGIRAAPGLAPLYISRSQAHAQNGNPERALADLDSAIQVEPITHSTFLLRGHLHFAQGHMDQAFSDYDAAVHLAETADKPTAYAARCFSLARVGRLQDALADCNTSMKLAPNNGIALHSRGYVYFRMEQYRQSIEDYDALLRMPGRLPAALFIRGVAKLRL